MRNPRNPYREVALSYLRDRYVWWFSGCSALFLLPQLFRPHPPGAMNMMLAGMSLSSVVFVTLAVFAHAQSQFADPRARLVPGFARPHLVTLVAVSMAVCACVVWVMAHVTSGSIVASLVLVTAFYWLTAWCLLIHNWVAMLLWFLIFVAPWTAVGQRFLQMTLVEVQVFPVVALAITAIVACGACLRRLVTLDEEQPAYHRRLIGGWDRNLGDMYKTMGNNYLVFRGVTNYSVDRRIGAYLRRGRWRRFWAIQRWHAALTPLLPQFAWVGLMMMVICGLIPGAIPGPKGSPREFSPMIVLMGLAWAVLAPGMVWRPRRAMLGQELLRPVTRARLFRQMGLGLALDAFQALAMITLLILALYAIEQPEHFFEPRTWLIVGVCWSWGVLAFGWGLWTMRFRSNRAWWVSSICGFYLGIVVIGAALRQSRPELVWRMWGIPVGVALAGLMLTYAAYHRWLVTDLE